MNHYQAIIKKYVRARFAVLAVVLNRKFGSWLTPNLVTLVGFAAHLPIAFLIAQDYLLIAGILLAVFGLFDTLDGAVARVQGVDSPKGMFLDASTDRLKEVLLYTGFSILFITSGPEWGVVAATLACGLSLAVSYVKAKGEAALALRKTNIEHQQLNRIFDDGIGSFETRISLLVIGCILGIPQYTIIFIILFTMITLITRFNKIMKAL